MQKRNLLDINLYDVSRKELTIFLDSVIKNNQKKTIFGISAAAYGRFKFRPDLYGVFQKFDILVAEGAGIPFLPNVLVLKFPKKSGW